ncbi:MAG: DMT family transporter [Anaerolineaceae bacterium]|nr:DMT family transporter [Anaerolineaceae bacterium]MCB9101890.1 DMT family transporter [Anaerolineales bacterium]
MLEIALTVFIGILGGIAVGIQSPIAGSISQRVGGLSSSFIIHASGAIFSAILLALRGGEQIQQWRTLPWYMLGAGSLGIVLYLSLSHTLPRLGASAAIVLIIIGQLVSGMIIDQFGLFGVPIRAIDSWRVSAAVLLIAGGYLMVK